MTDNKLSADMLKFINFIRVTYNAALDNFTEISDLSETFFRTIGKQTQNDLEQVMLDFINSTKKGREEFRSTMDANFKKIEDILKGQGNK